MVGDLHGHGSGTAPVVGAGTRGWGSGSLPFTGEYSSIFTARMVVLVTFCCAHTYGQLNLKDVEWILASLLKFSSSLRP